MRIDAWLAQTTELLSATSDSARLDAELMLLHVLEKPRSFLFTWPETLVNDDQQEQLTRLVKRRADGEPVAHLIGVREFWSLPLAVNNTTLIPRPDTESLVDAALELPLPKQARVVDLGTGTGAIALALASERPDWMISAVDRVEDAVSLARSNAKRLNLPVQVYHGSWFEPLTGRYDLIVTNPPYIDPEDTHLEQGDVRYEPLSALVAQEQGLADIRHLSEQAPDYLNSGGVLMTEHGYQQGAQVRQLFEKAGFVDVSTGTDLAGRERFTLGFYPN